MKRLIIDTDPGVDDAHALLLALAVAIESGIVTKSVEKHVSIELRGSQTRRQTVVDWYGQTQKPANTESILDLDQDRFIQLMEDGLR